MSRNAMVWGASGGIGRALIQALATNDWRVTAVSRHVDDIVDLADTVIAADPADDYQVQQAVMRAAQEADEINLWIYAAGDILASPVAELGPANWHRILDANLTGAFLATHYSLPLLAEDAHLIFIGAQHERLQLPGLAAYATAKAGLQAYTTTLAKEQRKRRVSLVRPGAVDTPLWKKVPLRLPKDALAADVVAEQIIDLYENGHKGTVEL